MILVLIMIFCMTILPITITLVFKLLFPKMAFSTLYVSSVIICLLLFSLIMYLMTIEIEQTSSAPIKMMLALFIIFFLVCVVMLGMQYARGKKLIQLFNIRWHFGAKDYRGECFILAVGCLVWMLGSVSYLCYVPDNAVELMAEVNRLKLYGGINKDPVIMLGYYFTNLFGISSAKAICIIIPVFFYSVFVITCWDLSIALFKDNIKKDSICFLAQGIMTLVGDCMYTQPHIVLHGLNDIGNILLVLCVPLVFSNGIRLCQDERSKWKEYCFTPIVCMICTFLLDKRTFALVSINVIIFVLLFIGRRYLPWLQSAKL